MDETTLVNSVQIIINHPFPEIQSPILDQFSWYRLSTQIFDSGDKKNSLEKLLSNVNSPEIDIESSNNPVAAQKQSRKNAVRHISPLARTQFEIQWQNKDDKILLLEKILNDDPGEETAWIWLSMATDAAERKLLYLKKILQINPDNENAERSYAQLIHEQNKKRFNRLPSETPANTVKISRHRGKMAVVAGIIVLILTALSFGPIGF